MAAPLDRSWATTDALDRAAAASHDAALTRRAIIILLLATDTAAICVAFGLAYLVRFKTGWDVFYTPPESRLDFYSTLVFLLVPLIVAVFAAYRLYSDAVIFDGPNEYARIVSATTLAMMLVILLSFLLESGLVVSRGWIVISWAALVVCVGANRFLLRRLVYRMRRAGRLGRRVVLVGSGSDVALVAEHIGATPESGLHVVAILNADTLAAAEPNGDISILRATVQHCRADAVIVSAASAPQSVLASIVRDLCDTPVDLQVIPGMYEILTTGVQVRELRGLPLVTMNKVRITGFDLVLKRSLDYLVAGGGLLALLPLVIAIALAVRLTSPGPVLHRRRVVGERGQRFDALKFRTMYVDGDAILAARPDLLAQLARDGKLPDDPRVTPVGRWLRRWSLDELPQLLNVLAGQMSLVGPRMITESELERFGHWQANLATVKPGLTGLWQVSGRSRLGYEDRVRLDMHYIRGYSIWSDLEILLRTVPAVIRGVGAY